VQFINTSQNATSYSWSFPGGNPSTSTQTNPIVTYNTAGTFNVVLTAHYGLLSDSDTQTIVINPLPNITITAVPPSICVDQSTTISASGASTYQWSNGMSSSSITVSPLTSTTYSVTGTSTAGCQNTGSISVNVYAKPNISATASPSSICIGGNSVLTATGANSYSWNNGMNSATITVSPSTTTTYTVTGTNTSACTNTATVTVNITTSINISATASPLNICAGDNAILMATGGDVYTWNNGMNGSQITVSPTTSTIYSVTGSSGGCTGSATVSITVYPLPDISVSAVPNTICVGQSTTISASGASTYQWSNGMSGSSITVSPTSTTIYTVTGTSSAGCHNINTVTITVNQLPTINITSNPSHICAGSSSTLTASGASSYIWSNNMSGSIITVSPSSTTTYTVTGTNSNNCSNTATATVIVESMPGAGNININATQICQNEALSLNLIGYTVGSNIQWQISSDGISWSDIIGATTSSYNYLPINSGIFHFRAKVSNSCGSVYSDEIIITINSLPISGIASINTSTVCQNNPVLLTLSGYSPNTTIQWQISNDNVSWSNINGATTFTYNYTPNNVGTFYIRAMVTNNCGNATSNTIILNVNAIPVAGNINVNDNNICQNENVILILSGQTPMTTLQWQISTDNNTWFNISGANTSSYNFIGNNVGTYYFRVLVSNDCGNATSNQINIIVNSIPPTPTITMISSYPIILFSSVSTGNQWYNESGAIPGAINQTYQVIVNGTYYVRVTQNDCQSLPSNAIIVNNVDIQSYYNDEVIIYPNPAQDIIYIQTDKKILEVRLIDALGRMVANTDTYQLNLDNISNGVYHLVIKFDDDVIVLPVIVKK
jgi:PKD repeat protein